MHIADVSLGVLGANGVVAGGVGIALGAALSSRRLGEDRVSVAFIGDGAMNQGVTFEVLNMAALWQLPLLVVCENNLYGQYSALADTLAGAVSDRARIFGIDAVGADGMDVEDVLAVVSVQVERARAAGGPSFVELRTYRYGGHHVAEVKSDYRTEDEIADWRARDPIVRYRERLIDRGVPAGTLDAIDAESAARGRTAREVGLAGACPIRPTLYEEVYA